jgi:hypothetical protein
MQYSSSSCILDLEKAILLFLLFREYHAKFLLLVHFRSAKGIFAFILKKIVPTK